MRHPNRNQLSALMLALILASSVAQAQQANDSGAVTLSGRVSGYVDISSGGPATLAGHIGGTITGNTIKGQRLTGVTIDLGDVSPANSNNFVTVTVPLRLRSNINYTLSVQTTAFSNADALAIQANDIGFGIDNVQRTDTGVNTAGTDSLVASSQGNPALDPDADGATPRWDFAPTKSLSYFTTLRAVLSGPRIMHVVPASHVGGLTVDTYFAVKPQFFTPGTFATTVTYTISTP